MTDEASEARIPLADALPGMGIHPFEENEIPISAFVFVKVLDRDGDPTWSFRTTEPPNREELLGVLVVQVGLLKASLASDWEID
jgi:hypothetical protein